jgi:predicted nucleotidyltransferase
MDESEKKRLEEEFERYERSWPESKLELLDGRLLVGNGLAGSRLLFQQLMRGWGAEAVVAWGSCEQWIEALCEAYRFTLPAGNEALARLEEQAAGVEFPEEDLSLSPGSQGDEADHWWVRRHLDDAAHSVCGRLDVQSLGRDFVMRLGEDAFTPDLHFFKSQGLNTLHEYFLDGPAELVIEVVRPLHRAYDREVKRERYARGGVPEYVIVDPEREEIALWRLVNGDYQRQQSDAGGRYRPASIPGLAIVPSDVWPEKSDSRESSKRPFIVEEAIEKLPKRQWEVDSDLRWGARVFAPRAGLLPERIRFEEFVSWCPRAKFEFWGGRPRIDGTFGTRNVIGMLLMSLGMIETCALAPPREWVAAIKQKRRQEAQDREIKDAWWRKAREVAGMLRAKRGFKRIGVTGDLLRERPLNFWSDLTLALYWEEGRKNSFDVYDDVAPFQDSIVPRIDLINGASKRLEKDADFLDTGMVDI